jgi:hypothetical protein
VIAFTFATRKEEREMSIEIGCRCGAGLKAKDEDAGLNARCPVCGTMVDIPCAPSAPKTIPDERGIEDLREGLEEDRLGSDREATLTDVWKVLNTIAKSIVGSAGAISSGGSQQREYEVFTQKDKWFLGKFVPDKLECLLNSDAKQG